MDWLGLTLEDYRWRFREATVGPDDRPFAYAQWLKDAATRWLQPESTGGSQAVTERVILEQFLEGLPARTSTWVFCHWPTSPEAAITLAEDHLAVYPCGQGDGGSMLAPTRPTPAQQRRLLSRPTPTLRRGVFTAYRVMPYVRCAQR